MPAGTVDFSTTTARLVELRATPIADCSTATRFASPVARAGVGLFIARRALSVMGGEIWVESEPGRGATFHVRVPLARPVAIAQSA